MPSGPPALVARVYPLGKKPEYRFTSFGVEYVAPKTLLEVTAEPHAFPQKKRQPGISV